MKIQQEEGKGVSFMDRPIALLTPPLPLPPALKGGDRGEKRVLQRQGA